MSKYINKRIYTDVESYLVTEINEAKGTAMAIEVEKRIKPKMIPCGFAAHCPNLDQEFDAAQPVVKDGATAFPITRNKVGIQNRGDRSGASGGGLQSRVDRKQAQRPGRIDRRRLHLLFRDDQRREAENHLQEARHLERYLRIFLRLQLLI